MSLIRRALETRSIDVGTLPSFSAGRWTSGIALSSNGPIESRSLQMSAVFACIRILTEAVSTLPLDTYRRNNGTRLPYRPRPAYLDFQPPGLPRNVYMSQVMLSALQAGEALVATPRNNLGQVVGLWPLQPELVQMEWVNDDPTQGKLFRIEGQVFTELDIMHIPAMVQPGRLRGVSPLRHAREAIEGGLRAQDYGRKFFENASVPPAIIETDGQPGPETMDRAKKMAEIWQETHGGANNAGKIGVLVGGRMKTVAVSPEDSQWLESRRFGVSEIARFFGVPPHLIADASNSTSWGSGLAEQNLAFGQFSLRPWVERIEEAHNRLLTTEGLPDVFVKLNLDALLRPSLSDRYESHATGIASGFLTINEARRLEDLPPVAWGDQPALPQPRDVMP